MEKENKLRGMGELLPSVEDIESKREGKPAPHELADSVNLILKFTGVDPKGKWGRGYLSKIVKRSGKGYFEVGTIIKDLVDCPVHMKGGAVTNRLLGKTKNKYYSQNKG